MITFASTRPFARYMALLMALRLILPAFAGLTAAVPAGAQNFDDVLQARLITGWRQADGSHMAAVQLDLAPGWHTYWRAPGDAGIPTLFDTRASRNLASSAVVWPRPQVFVQNGYRSIGYEGRVILPLRVEPDVRGQDITFNAQIDLGVCKDICIPQSLKVTAVLPGAGGARDARIASALADRPYTAREAGARDVTCAMTPTTDGIALTTRFAMPQIKGAETVVIETGNRLHWISAPEMQRDGGWITAVAEVQHVEGAPLVIKREAVTISVIGSGSSVEIRGCARG